MFALHEPGNPGKTINFCNFAPNQCSFSVHRTFGSVFKIRFPVLVACKQKEAALINENDVIT